MSPQHNTTMPEVSKKENKSPVIHNATIEKSGNVAQPQPIETNTSQLKSIGLDTKSKEQTALSSSTSLRQPVYGKTILDSVQVGDIVQIIANLEILTKETVKDNSQPTSSPAVFSATCFQDQDQDLPVLDYVLGTLQDDNRLKQLKPLDQFDKKLVNEFEEGKVVIAFDETENAYSRYIYLSPDTNQKKATLYNIDSPKELSNVTFSKILPAEAESYSHPALGFQFRAIGMMTPNLVQQVMQMAVKESFEAKVLFVKYLNDGRLKHITAALLNSDKNPIMTYKVSPYYMNKKVAEFLKIQSSCMANSLKSVELSVKDQVHGVWDATIKFGQWSDMLLIMRVQDIERRKELQNILHKYCTNAPPINIGEEIDIQKLRGQLVACRFSKDGKFYRAVVTGTKPDKARLHFVDFGNIEGKYCGITLAYIVAKIL